MVMEWIRNKLGKNPIIVDTVLNDSNFYDFWQVLKSKKLANFIIFYDEEIGEEVSDVKAAAYGRILGDDIGTIIMLGKGLDLILNHGRRTNGQKFLQQVLEKKE